MVSNLASSSAPADMTPSTPVKTIRDQRQKEINQRKDEQDRLNGSKIIAGTQTAASPAAMPAAAEAKAPSSTRKWSLLTMASVGVLALGAALVAAAAVAVFVFAAPIAMPVMAAAGVGAGLTLAGVAGAVGFGYKAYQAYKA